MAISRRCEARSPWPPKRPSPSGRGQWSPAGGTRSSGSRPKVEHQPVPELPRDVVVGAGGITADAHRADQLAAGVVERQPAPEDIDPPDALADHEVAGGAVVIRVAAVRHRRVNRVALL